MHILQKTAAVILAAFICVSPGMASAVSQHPEQLVKKKDAVISKDQAKKIALTTIPGRITKISLKKDDGRLVYKVIVLMNGSEHKIKIDAITGKVLKVKHKD
ncbi:PepSY domain-containing protein [Metabacillus sp. RGM 3146]|uniref:PepSY domain-containing protein n=1 Tax=Metabacillus sp. RGM 3146 TaxID=3401092 RepID=UPI003B9A53E2